MVDATWAVPSLGGVRAYAFLLGLLLLAGACIEPLPADATGAEIFAATCARCHGVDARGGSIGPDLGPESEAATKDDAALVLTVTRGRGRMPAFGSELSADQIDRVVAYLRSIQAGE